MSIDYENINSVLSIFDAQARKFADKPYLWRKVQNKYESLSWNEVYNKVSKTTLALSELGIIAGDRVAIISENRPEWQIADLAIMSIGAITVPAYTTSTTNDYEYILNHSGARCVFISNHELSKKILPAVLNSPKCQTVIKFDEENIKYEEPIQILQFNSLIKENINKNFELNKLINKHKRKDAACIIYTSGTGGNPKGVMLSHGAMLTNCTGAAYLLKNLLKNLNEIRFLSWLPLSHSYEHTLQFLQMGIGAEIYYAESIDKLVINMSEAKPHFMTAVPRFYDSLHTRISQGLKNQKKISQFLFAATLNLGKKNYLNKKMNKFKKLSNKILDKIVRRKVN